MAASKRCSDDQLGSLELTDCASGRVASGFKDVIHGVTDQIKQKPIDNDVLTHKYVSLAKRIIAEK